MYLLWNRLAVISALIMSKKADHEYFYSFYYKPPVAFSCYVTFDPMKFCQVKLITNTYSNTTVLRKVNPNLVNVYLV